MNALLRYVVFISFMMLVIILISNLFPAAYDLISGVSKVAKISVHTELSVDSSILSGVTSVDSIISEIKSADVDNSIDAILLDINSPGGGVVASYELAKAIQQVSKPIVSVIREVGASGAYWAAISSDYVIANDLSIVGSVGVVANYLEFSGLMEKFGVSEVRAVSGEMKDFGSPYHNLTQAQRVELDRLVNLTFQFFFNDFKNLRTVNDSVLSQVVTGKTFLGIEAYSLGLIDALGGFDVANNYLKNVLESNNVEYVEDSKSFSLIDLLSSVKDSFNPLSFSGNGLSIKS